MTSDLFLREVLESDLSIFFEQQLDPETNYRAAFAADDPTDRQAFDAHWRKKLNNPDVTIRTIVWNNQVAGYISNNQDFPFPEVSYWLGKAFWGKGIATQALRDFLANVTIYRPLYARAAFDNLASLTVLEKCGFVAVGQARVYANTRGEEIYEWVLELDEPNRSWPEFHPPSPSS